jgi:hypothetical protein
VLSKLVAALPLPGDGGGESDDLPPPPIGHPAIIGFSKFPVSTVSRSRGHCCLIFLGTIKLVTERLLSLIRQLVASRNKSTDVVGGTVDGVMELGLC